MLQTICVVTQINSFYEMAGGSPCCEDIPDLPANPYQQQMTAFLKQSFGKVNLVY